MRPQSSRDKRGSSSKRAVNHDKVNPDKETKEDKVEAISLKLKKENFLFPIPDNDEYLFLAKITKDNTQPIAQTLILHSLEEIQIKLPKMFYRQIKNLRSSADFIGSIILVNIPKYHFDDAGWVPLQKKGILFYIYTQKEVENLIRSGFSYDISMIGGLLDSRFVREGEGKTRTNYYSEPDSESDSESSIIVHLESCEKVKEHLQNRSEEGFEQVNYFSQDPKKARKIKVTKETKGKNVFPFEKQPEKVLKPYVVDLSQQYIVEIDHQIFQENINQKVSCSGHLILPSGGARVRVNTNLLERFCCGSDARYAQWEIEALMQKKENSEEAKNSIREKIKEINAEKKELEASGASKKDIKAKSNKYFSLKGQLDNFDEEIETEISKKLDRINRCETAKSWVIDHINSTGSFIGLKMKVTIAKKGDEFKVKRVHNIIPPTFSLTTSSEPVKALTIADFPALTSKLSPEKAEHSDSESDFYYVPTRTITNPEDIQQHRLLFA